MLHGKIFFYYFFFFGQKKTPTNPFWTSVRFTVKHLLAISEIEKET